MKKTVRYLAIAFTILYAVFVVTAIALVVKREMPLNVFASIAVSVGISLILLWALDNALARIERLENILLKKDVITDDDIMREKLEDEDSEQDIEPSEIAETCQNCGYQLFPEDDVCPNCKTPRRP